MADYWCEDEQDKLPPANETYVEAGAQILTPVRKPKVQIEAKNMTIFDFSIIHFIKYP